MAPQAGSDMEEMSAIEAMLAKTLGRILNDEQRTDVLAPEQYVSHLLMRDKPDHKVLDAYGKHFAPPYLFVMLMRPVVNEAELQYVLGHICRTQPQVIGCASESRYLYLLIAGMDSETARVMIHQPLGGAQGQASDIEITAREIRKTKQELYEIIAAHSGAPIEKIEKDADRDYCCRSGGQGVRADRRGADQAGIIFLFQSAGDGRFRERKCIVSDQRRQSGASIGRAE